MKFGMNASKIQRFGSWSHQPSYVFPAAEDLRDTFYDLHDFK